ncbi:MAG: cupin domain-containing protein [Loktanella sp.]|nr:cupin domain-containing protein [Loktanella sp.]
MSNTFQPVTKTNATPEISRPAPEKLIAGDPLFTTWNIEESDGLFAGIWQSTPGKWRVSYDEWEYFTLTAGKSILTPDGGLPVVLTIGDSYIIRAGFTGTWEVVETTVKDYVIRL